MEWNQGNSSGNGIGCVSWDGEVYADQFWGPDPACYLTDEEITGEPVGLVEPTVRE